jgi:diguanylate cyclase (GGDEF)-like protein
MLDISRRLRSVQVVIISIVVVFAAVAIPTCGWALLVSTVLASVSFWVLTSRRSRSSRPEYLSFLAVVIAELALAAGVIASAGPRILLVELLVIPTLLYGTAWPRRGLAAATVITALAMLVVASLVDGSGVLQTPPLLIYPLAVLLSTVLVASAAQGADVESRAAAVVDRLTGLLNRGALLPRAAELTHQAALTGEPVAVILGDIDHFKEVNDRYGHSRGDAILAGVAGRLRDALGPAESVYRFGGEEFVALVPGANGVAGAASAEMLREAVGREAIDGLAMTMSFGVAASGPQERFDFEALFDAADTALYAAKAQGRDRVCRAESVNGPLPEPTRARAATAAAISERRMGRHSSARPGVTPVFVEAQDAGRLAEHVARHRAATGSWLVPDEAARAHMLDLLHRLRRVRIVTYGVVLLALVAAGPFYGWRPILPPATAALILAAVIERVDGRRRPEFAIGAAVALSLVANAAGFLLCHGAPFIAIPLLVVPVFAWSPMFSARGVAMAAGIDSVLIVAAGLLIGRHAALSDPVILGVPLALLASAAFIGSVLGRSAIDHRSAAVVDQLTGMLNRQALESRIAAVAHQVAYSGEPVAVVTGDIDHFKQINDTEGHYTGDAVLREVAYRIRKGLRAFEAAYRVGGEEFVVLLTGLHAQEAAEIAERLRGVVRREPIRGLPVTMSFGVAGTTDGEPFDYAPLFARADASLYEAKRGGRDRVCLAEDASPRPDSLPAASAVSVAA